MSWKTTFLRIFFLKLVNFQINNLFYIYCRCPCWSIHSVWSYSGTRIYIKVGTNENGGGWGRRLLLVVKCLPVDVIDFLFISTWPSSWKIYISVYALSSRMNMPCVQRSRRGVVNCLPHSSCFMFHVFITSDHVKMHQNLTLNVVNISVWAIIGAAKLTLLHYSVFYSKN
jgi:hypothetical protein